MPSEVEGAPVEVFALADGGEGNHGGLCDHDGGRDVLRCCCGLPANEEGGLAWECYARALADGVWQWIESAIEVRSSAGVLMQGATVGCL